MRLLAATATSLFLLASARAGANQEVASKWRDIGADHHACA